MANLICGGCVFLCLVGGAYACWMLSDCYRQAVADRRENKQPNWRRRIDWLSQVVGAGVFLVVGGSLLLVTGKECVQATRSRSKSNGGAVYSVEVPGLRALPPRRIKYDLHDPRQPIVGADFACLPITNDDVRALLEHSPELEWLNLNGTCVTDEILRGVAQMPHLSYLCVANTSITDAGLAELTAVEGLTSLSLAGTAVTDAGLVHIGELTDLRRLHLQRTSVTDTGLESLGDLRRLETLLVEETQVTRQGYKRIRRKLVETPSAD